jgi:DNA-binding Lrp family transcriptional regulator
MMDKINELILSTLSRNAKQGTQEIWDFLRENEHYLSEGDIESRISKLEEDHTIKGYTIAVDTKNYDE